MYCIRIRVRPGTAGDSAAWAGAYVNCYIDYPDSRGAEVLARWYVADMGWVPELVMEMRTVDLEQIEPEYEQYIQEAHADGVCVVAHSWPTGAGDDEAEAPADWDPPGEHEGRLATIAGTYVDADSADSVLNLRTDRHFGWGRNSTRHEGTWHVAGDELTLVYFPAEEGAKAVLDDAWRVLPGAVAGPEATLRKEREDT